MLPIHNVKQRRALFPSRTRRLCTCWGEGHTISFSRCGYRIRGLLHASRKPVQTPQINEGGRAPKGAYLLAVPGGARRAPHERMLPSVRASGALAFRRSTAVLASWLAPTDSAPGHASWDAGRAGVTRPRLSQSRDCTSRTGRSTGVTDARSRPGTVCETARGNRTCSTF
jgi:hypothetical protein